MAITDNRTTPQLELKVVGRRPKHKPYLRIAYAENGDYVASIDDAKILRGLANQILRALAGKTGGTRIPPRRR